jgi:hypothetical protein
MTQTRRNHRIPQTKRLHSPPCQGPNPPLPSLAIVQLLDKQGLMLPVAHETAPFALDELGLLVVSFLVQAQTSYSLMSTYGS